jgi:putative flippase GtrA
MHESSRQSKRPLIFFFVGIGNTLFDFLFYTLLTSTAFKDGKHIALAGLISGSFALVCAFLAHSFITWRGSDVTHKTAIKFVAFTGFGLWIIRPLLLSLFIKMHGLYDWARSIADHIGLHFSYNFVANTGAFGFMALIVLFYNYYVYSHYVFTDSKPAAE